MKKTDKEWKKDGYLLRLSRWEDAVNYYTQNFCPLDAEVIRLTGSRQSYTWEEVVGFFMQWVQAEDRYDFLLIAGEEYADDILMAILEEEWRNLNGKVSF